MTVADVPWPQTSAPRVSAASLSADQTNSFNSLKLVVLTAALNVQLGSQGIRGSITAKYGANT